MCARAVVRAGEQDDWRALVPLHAMHGVAAHVEAAQRLAAVRTVNHSLTARSVEPDASVLERPDIAISDSVEKIKESVAPNVSHLFLEPFSMPAIIENGKYDFDSCVSVGLD